jgi:phytoene dehydrogenase-like protein
MLKDLGIELELLKSPVSMGVEGRIVDMASPDGLGDYRGLLESLYPGHEKEVGRIFRAIAKVMRDMDVIYGFDNPVFRDFKHDRAYIFKELLPWMAKFLPAVARMNRMDEAIESFLAGISSFRPLNDIIDQHFFKRTPMFFALGYFYVYQDYLYPKGGTGEFPAKLAEKILAAGGEIRLDTEVTSILPSEKRLAGSQGLDCGYDSLVWCADLKSLYALADTAGLDKAAIKGIEAQRSLVMASRGGDSVFSLYLGVDGSPEEFASTTHGHLFYTPSREGLGETHRGELARLLESSGEASREAILAWVGKYCRLTTYEISIPSLRDPALSPTGRTGMIASFLFEYDLVRKVTEDGWYEDFKARVEDAMIEVLDASLFPGIKDRIVLRFSSSPSTIKTMFASSEGGITGWTFERDAPVINILQKIPKAVLSPFPSIFQAGQWAYSPAGIPTAILTGWYAQDAIRRQGRA